MSFWKRKNYALPDADFQFKGFCWRCGDGSAPHHVTMITAGSGVAPLCERCWRALPRTQRLVYYAELIRWWDDPRCHPGREYELTPPEAVEAIVRAVMTEPES